MEVVDSKNGSLLIHVCKRVIYVGHDTLVIFVITLIGLPHPLIPYTSSIIMTLIFIFHLSLPSN